MAGITYTGFQPKTEAEIRGELVDAMRRQFGADIDLDDASYEGALLNALAAMVAANWGHLGDVYSQLSHQTAEGRHLEALASWLGLQRASGETDVRLRRRMFNYIKAPIPGSKESIAERLLRVTGITYARVFTSTDDNSIDPGTLRAVIAGAPTTAADLIDAFEDSITIGISTQGAQSAGIFSYDTAAPKPIHLDLTFRVTGNEAPKDIEERIVNLSLLVTELGINYPLYHSDVINALVHDHEPYIKLSVLIKLPDNTVINDGAAAGFTSYYTLNPDNVQYTFAK